jgi:hypothetical protein
MGMKVNGTSGLTFPDTTTLASAGQASVRAWVNFNGTGTVAIRASYNVTSITDNGTGNYTVNFTTALPDANYSAVALSGSGTIVVQGNGLYIGPTTTTSFQLANYYAPAAVYVDREYNSVAIFR